MNGNHLGCNCYRLKSEECVGEVLTNIIPEYKFKKIRPDWLKNFKTEKNFELDFYCEELKLAIEYQGLQHEEYVPFFHNNDINNFYIQQENDKFKKKVCEKKA